MFTLETGKKQRPMGFIIAKQCQRFAGALDNWLGEGLVAQAITAIFTSFPFAALIAGGLKGSVTPLAGGLLLLIPVSGYWFGHRRNQLQEASRKAMFALLSRWDELRPKRQRAAKYLLGQAGLTVFAERWLVKKIGMADLQSEDLETVLRFFEDAARTFDNWRYAEDLFVERILPQLLAYWKYARAHYEKQTENRPLSANALDAVFTRYHEQHFQLTEQGALTDLLRAEAKG